MIGNIPYRIDIFSSISGVEFDNAFKARIIQDIGNIKDINIISYEDLLKNKKASNRKKDKEALSWLKTYGKNNRDI